MRAVEWFALFHTESQCDTRSIHSTSLRSELSEANTPNENVGGSSTLKIKRNSAREHFRQGPYFRRPVHCSVRLYGHLNESLAFTANLPDTSLGTDWFEDREAS